MIVIHPLLNREQTDFAFRIVDQFERKTEGYGKLCPITGSIVPLGQSLVVVKDHVTTRL